jgi:putative methyltransferase (TIGR04325 family)
MLQFFKDIYFRYWKGWGWFGNYKTWQAAVADCDGYDAEGIFQKVYQASLKVRNGEAAYERDGHVFYEKEDNIFLKECLEKVLNTEGGLRVLDFGGALGSTYYQHQDFLKKETIEWAIVEQKPFVDLGKRDFETENLHFYESIEAATEAISPNVILFSSVLQYLDDPNFWIQKVASLKIPYIILDLTVVVKDVYQDRITKQIVPPQLYKASYACRLMGEKRLKALLDTFYTLEKDETAHYRNNILSCRFKKYFGVLIRRQ